jgi:cysteinyl-tRNA synthetase
MALRFFNTYSRKIEEFEPRDPAARTISIYTCGPTVYSRAHIGNFHSRENRCDVFFVARILLSRESDERFTRRVSQRNRVAPREWMVV